MSYLVGHVIDKKGTQQIGTGAHNIEELKGGLLIFGVRLRLELDVAIIQTNDFVQYIYHIFIFFSLA